MSLAQVVGYLMVIGPIALLLYMFIKSEIDLQSALEKYKELYL